MRYLIKLPKIRFFLFPFFPFFVFPPTSPLLRKFLIEDDVELEIQPSDRLPV